MSLGKVVKIQPFSVNDGDGIRTTVFLEGCGLKCKWCSNPESWNNIVKLGFAKHKCIDCKTCTRLCPQKITCISNRYEINEKCNLCGKCVSNCKGNALSIMTTQMSVDEIVKKVEKDMIFFLESGGGVTFSGGEPTYQTSFLRDLVNYFYNKGIHTAIETCGYFNWEKCNDIFEKLDHIFIDIKVMDENKHREYTGLSNKVILENIAHIGRLNKSTVIRIPVIPNVNDDLENIEKTAMYVKEHIKDPKIELLPYHKLGIDKYKLLGLDDYIYEFDNIDRDKIEHLKKVIEELGVKCVEYK
jgi:pyruvate formate lyase activating enzyme